jgi:hypothetical protein
MPRHADSARIDLSEVFLLVQRQMLACLQVGDAFEHPGASGAASEQRWIDLFNGYLPQRYRASPAFVVDADGRRSRQIDLAIYDNLYSPLLFPHDSGVHIAAESVYAVFEVKQTLTRQLLRDAGQKIASVRALRRTTAPIVSGGATRAAIQPVPILGGILAVRSVWADKQFQTRIAAALNSLSGPARLDLGCVLQQAAFESRPGRTFHFSAPNESLIFFVLRLFERLRAQGTAPAADLMQYGRALDSFRNAA